MQELMRAVKSFGLTEFYFSLSVTDKTSLSKYSQYLNCNPYNSGCSPKCEGCFIVSNGAQFLWATAANAIPHKKYEFAKKLLDYALIIASEVEDIAWIHANLAQIHYDNHKLDPKAGKKSILHCRELIKLGFMKSWARNMIEELMVFQI